MRYSLRLVENIQPKQQLFSLVSESGRNLLDEEIEALMEAGVSQDNIKHIFSTCETALSNKLPVSMFKKLHTPDGDIWEVKHRSPPLRMYLGRLRWPSSWVVLSLSFKRDQKREIRRIVRFKRDYVNNINYIEYE